mgnify:CR=1 FL=1
MGRHGLEELIKRDVKGMYKKALAGEIKNFTGVDDRMTLSITESWFFGIDALDHPTQLVIDTTGNGEFSILPFGLTCGPGHQGALLSGHTPRPGSRSPGAPSPRSRRP